MEKYNFYQLLKRFYNIPDNPGHPSDEELQNEISNSGTIENIVALQKDKGTTHLVLFQNVDFTSSDFGSSTIVAIGPNRTYKTLAEVFGKWLNDLPSQRQYPIAYWEKE
jgi:hypothetical protein